MENSNMENATDTFDISRLQALAEAGDTDATYKLGLCYKFGLNVDEDAAQTAIWAIRPVIMRRQPMSFSI